MKRTFIEQLSTFVLVIHIALTCLSASLDYMPYCDRHYIPFYVYAQPSYCHIVCIQYFLNKWMKQLIWLYTEKNSGESTS